jgi:hypothetical protein
VVCGTALRVAKMVVLPVTITGEFGPPGCVETDAGEVGFPETGQMVVYNGMMTVVTDPIGQLVTVLRRVRV